MKVVKIRPNKRIGKPAKVNFKFVLDDKELLLPIELYNFLVTNNISTATDMVIFIQNHPKLMCLALGWNFDELKRAYLALLQSIKATLPESVIKKISKAH